MRVGWGLVLALGALALGGAAAKPASAQVTVYADLSASKLTNLVGTNVLFGPTLGVTTQLVSLKHFIVAGDLRGSFVGGSQRLDGIAVGPRVSLPLHRLEPYGEFLAGFARYNDGLGTPSSGTTDGQIQINFGVDHRITPALDWRVFEFGYSQYYALGGQFNPKTFSTGVVYHVGGRH